jgi:cytochrome c biogenesis protein CcmG/thiol:disulfide interchange protein DsbE
VKRGFLITIIGVLCVAFLVARLRPRTPAPPPLLPEPVKAERMPQFCLDDLQGRKVCSSEFAGKVLLVDFWASTCVPCRREMPAYQRFQEQYGSRGFAAIGIGITMDSRTEAEKFARALKIKYTLLIGTPDVEKDFGILGIPTTILVDRGGVIRKRVVGFEYPEEFESALKSLL